MLKTTQNSNYIINKNISNSVNISPLYTNDVEDSNLQEINIGNYTDDIEIGDNAKIINIRGPDTLIRKCSLSMLYPSIFWSRNRRNFTIYYKLYNTYYTTSSNQF